jgi:hypothetical protein
MAQNAPRLFDKMNESTIDSMQNSGEPAKANRPDGLYQTNSNLRERGDEDRFTLERSVYQQAKIHPLLTTGILLGGGGLALAAFLGSRKTKTRENGEYHFDAGRNLTTNTHGEIREKMEVVGSDGAHLGTIDRVEGERIKLTRKDSIDGRHHYISTNTVESVAGEKVTLMQTAEQARRLWQTENAVNHNEQNDSTRGDKSKFATGS